MPCLTDYSFSDSSETIILITEADCLA
jgi:hypothetical protein